MGPQEYVETLVKRYMAQALSEFEEGIEYPLEAVLKDGADPTETMLRISGAIPGVKRTFRKRLQTLGDDCLVLIPASVDINAFDLVRRST